MRSWSDYHAQEDPTEATVECAGLAVKERCNAEGVPSARQRAMCWKPSTWPRTAENRGWQEEVKTPLQESGRLAWMTIRGEEPSSSAGHRAPSSVTQGEGGEAEAAEAESAEAAEREEREGAEDVGAEAETPEDAGAEDETAEDGEAEDAEIDGHAAGNEEEAEEEEDQEAEDPHQEPEDPLVVAARGRGPRFPDYWMPYPAHGQIERYHANPRSRLYVPDYDTAPVPLENLRNERDTVFTTARGARVMIRDDWRAEGAIELGYGQWVGASRFYLAGSPLPPLRSRSEVGNFEGTETEPEEQPSEGEISSPAGELLPQLDAANQVRAGGARGSKDGIAAVYAAPNQTAKERAERYVAQIRAFSGSRKDWSCAAKAGNDLLEAAGSVEEAAKSLMINDHHSDELLDKSAIKGSTTQSQSDRSTGPV